jgi:hypothetical protein
MATNRSRRMLLGKIERADPAPRNTPSIRLAFRSCLLRGIVFEEGHSMRAAELLHSVRFHLTDMPIGVPGPGEFQVRKRSSRSDLQLIRYIGIFPGLGTKGATHSK